MLMETTHWAIYQTVLDKNGSLKLYASRKPGLLVPIYFCLGDYHTIGRYTCCAGISIFIRMKLGTMLLPLRLKILRFEITKL